MYFSPIVRSGPRPEDAVSLAGGPLWFDQVQVLRRNVAPETLDWRAVPDDRLDALTARRADLLGLSLDRTRVMGILNLTPDSFSDGGQFAAPNLAIDRVRQMVADGVDLLDFGGESTRPGAAFVAVEEEIARTVPVIAAVAHQGVPVSIDTRKSQVAKAALDAGASMVNDISGLTFDEDMAALVARTRVPICIMHAQGDPKTMQDAPHYDDVLLDVYDWLAGQIARAEEAGIIRDQIIIDPGIGFGKTLDHNLTLLKNIALFHGLGCPILLGVSRKGFIGVIGNAPQAAERLGGSLALGLFAASQGVQILRVHDTRDTVQGLKLWATMMGT